MPSGVRTNCLTVLNGNAEVHWGENHCKQNTSQLYSKNKKAPTLRNCPEDIRIRAPLLTVLSIFLFSSSYVIADLWRPPAFPKRLGQISPRSLCFHRPKTLGRILRSMLGGTRHTTCWGFPPCVGVPEGWGYVTLALSRFLTL